LSLLRGLIREEVMLKGLLKRYQVGKGRTLVLAMDTYTKTPSPRKQAFYCPKTIR
jgi:hypothetical protein